MATTAKTAEWWNALLKAGIAPRHDSRIRVVSSQRNARCGPEGPRQGNDIIAVSEFTPDMMKEVHRQWLEVPSGIKDRRIHGGKLSRVSILVKSFLRDGYLFRCLAGIGSTAARRAKARKPQSRKPIRRLRAVKASTCSARLNHFDPNQG